MLDGSSGLSWPVSAVINPKRRTDSVRPILTIGVVWNTLGDPLFVCCDCQFSFDSFQYSARQGGVQGETLP